jgi:kynurenine formamidase
MKIIDLTHELVPEVPSWDGNIGFELSTVVDYEDCTPPDLFRIQKIKCGLSMGTHIDAPAHVIPLGRNIDQLTLEELVVDCVVINVSDEAGPEYIAMPEVVEKFEKEHGLIQPNTFVIFYTGWSKNWSDRNKYHNEHKFPAIHESTARLLVGKGITGIGIDTFSADTGANGYPVHNIVLGADKYLVENIANADQLPATGSKISILPMKIKNGTEAPIRLIASV